MREELVGGSTGVRATIAHFVYLLNFVLVKNVRGQAEWCTPLVSALGKPGRQISEVETSLGNRGSSMMARTMQRNPVLWERKKKKNKTKSLCYYLFIHIFTKLQVLSKALTAILQIHFK